MYLEQCVAMGPKPLPIGGMDIFPEIWFDLAHSQPSAFCLAFSPTSSIPEGLGKLSQEGISGLPQSLERISLLYKYSVSLLKVDR